MLASSCRGELVHPRRLPRGERGVWGGAPGLDTARVPLPAIAVREHQNIKSGDHTHQNAGLPMPMAALLKNGWRR